MFNNVPTFTPMYQRVRDGGIGLVTEERLVFTKMSARDNLRIGGGSVEGALALFPELEPRLSVRGGMLSGGEQQMLALARALSRKPSLLLADELSLGLAPKIVDRLLGAVRTAADEHGTGALIVEQHAHKALKYADRMYLMARGQILLELPAAEAIARLDEIEDAYLRGTSETEEDHIERLRRKNKRKQWRRQRVRERELERLTGKIVSTRKAEDDDYYFEKERKLAILGQASEEVADMGYRTAELPPVELDEFATIPFFERMKMLQLHWVEHGFGTPKQTITFYVWKIFFYALFGLIVAGAFTKGLEFDNIGGWWDEPILYQKLMIWTILLEILGLAATCGPLAFHFDPPIGGVLYWWQNDTLRVPPYPNHVPFTRGNRRTPWDTGLYKLIVFWLIMMLFLSGEQVDGLPEGRAGMMPQWALVTYCCLILLMGLRDKIVFLSARSEQYVPTLLYFGLFSNFVDMIVAAKICIVVIWMGAGFSKLQHGFSSTVSIMVQNTPWMVSQKFRKATVKDYPNDIRPSKITHLLAHVGGTTCEIVMPLVLLFSPWPWLTWIAIISIWMLHTFIISTIPLAVPLEWNVFFMFCAGFLFANFPPSDGYGVGDMNPVAAGASS